MDTLRIFGIVLFAAAVFAGGLALSYAQSEPLKYAKAFVSLITRLRGYIEYNRGELAQLYALCSGGETTPLESVGFLADAAELGWDDAFGRLCRRVSLDADTRAALEEFGGLLGKTCYEEQLRNCDRAVARLNNIIGAQTPEVAKQTKLWRTLGAAGALAVVIMLI